MITVGKYRIYKRDQYNWVIEEKHITEKDEVVYRNQKFYVKLEHAALKLLDNLAGEFETSSIEEMISFLNIAKTEIIKAIENQTKEEK